MLLFFTAALIGLLQYALIRLPNRSGRFSIDAFKNTTSAVQSVVDHVPDIHVKRQTSHAPKQSYVPAEETTTIPLASTTAVDDYVPTSSTYGYRPPEDYVPPTSTFFSRPRDDYIPPTETRTIASTRPSDDYVPETTTVGATAPAAYVQTIESSQSEVPVGSAPPSDYVGGSYTISLTSAPAPSVYVPAEGTVSYSTASDGYVYTVSTPTATPGHPAPGVYVPDEEKKGVVVVVTWSPLQIFLGTYLAVLLAVIYRILISTVQTQMHLIDPFRQLVSSKGAAASTAFFASYHSQTVFGPVTALLKGRLMIFLIGVTFWLSCLLPALASEAIWVDTNWGCPNPRVGSPNACPPRVTASVLVIRVMQGLLGVSALILVALACAMRLETGLDRDPSSITAVAALMGHPALERDLGELSSGPEVTISSMKQEIIGRRYRLADWHGASGEHRRGIVPASIDESEIAGPSAPAYATSGPTYSTVPYQPLDPRSSSYQDTVVSKRWRWTDCTLLFLVTGTFGVVLAYYLVGGDNGFNRFFNSNNFGPRFILTGAATIIANIWGSVEQNSMVMAPFVRLARAPATSHTLTFAPTITPILSTWRALSHGYVFAGTVTIMTLLGEILNIAISGVPFSTGQTWMNFVVVSYMSMAILGLMILAAVAVIFHRRHEPNIPLVPDTLGGKMIYLAGSNIGTNLNSGHLNGGKFSFSPVIETGGKRSWKIEQLGNEQDMY